MHKIFNILNSTYADDKYGQSGCCLVQSHFKMNYYVSKTNKL